MTGTTTALALFPLLLAAGTVLQAGLQQGAAPQQPPVQFEARAELILVDATVVDDTGTPVGDLTREDFMVLVDGQPRPIASLQFVKSEPAAASAPRSTPSHYSTNEGESEARRIMIVVDENSIPPGSGRVVLRSIERLLKDLSPADRVGFIRLPRFENSIDFTLDRGRVLDAVGKTTGKADRVGVSPVTISEAVALNRRDTYAWERALIRICGRSTPSNVPTPGGGGGTMAAPDPELAACRQMAQSDAVAKVVTYQQRARETVHALGELLSNLRAVPGPKTLILLSQGFLSYDMHLEISRLGDAAAAARVTLYAVHIDMQGMDIDARASSSLTRSDDERLMADGTHDLAGVARGARFRIVGSGDNVFARVARELSGYYLIGLEPLDSDRDGKPHRLKVDVRRPSMTVRARAQFTIGALAAESAPVTPGARLVEVLRAATPAAGIPLRLAAFAAPGAAAGRIKVVLSADIGGPHVSSGDPQVGFLILNADGTVVANQFVAGAIRPEGEDEASVLRYVGHADVPSGNYTVRFAVIGGGGRAGSVHHPIAAKLMEAGGVRASDLILSTTVRDGTLRPDVHVNLEGETLHALLELAADDASRLSRTRVTFEVADTAGGAAIISEPAVLGESDERVSPAAATLQVGVLPAGDYVARAVINVPGEKPLVTTRPFQVAPRRRAEAPAGAARSGTPAVSRRRVRPPIPPFKPQDVLAPHVVGPFVDHVLTRYSPSPAARQALAAIKTGDLQSTKLDRQVGDVGLSFAQGLKLLAENRIAEASAYFRAALRSESDFIGAAFYLGATLAAAGKDRDAVGAWQTALIGDVGAAGVYPVLIDGLLRLNEADQALDMLKEAESTFADRTAYDRRLAQVYSLQARFSDALPLAHAYLSKHPADLDMLYLTMHMIYEAHVSGELSEPVVELDRFRDYAQRYAASKGPQLEVVQGWRRALGIR